MFGFVGVFLVLCSPRMCSVLLLPVIHVEEPWKPRLTGALQGEDTCGRTPVPLGSRCGLLRPVPGSWQAQDKEEES